MILDVRRTKPVRRAHASIWAVAKNSVTFSTMPSHGSAIAVSFASPADDNPMPSYYELETATSPRILHTYPVSFMPMAPSPPCHTRRRTTREECTPLRSAGRLGEFGQTFQQFALAGG